MKRKIQLREAVLITIANTIFFLTIGLIGIQSIILSTVLFMLLSLTVALGVFIFQGKKVYSLLDAVKNILTQFNDGKFTTNLNAKEKHQELISVIEEFEKLKLMLNTWVYELLKSSVSIKLSASQISESSENTSQGMVNLNKSLFDISQFVEDTAQMMADVAGATNQLAQSCNQIADNSDLAVKKVKLANQAAVEGGESMQQVAVSMEQILENVSDSSHAIENLGNTTYKIEEITHTIASISNQTTMLALNASIESARAGEHGKGFAVVASEVGKLSVETKKAVEQINHLVLTIKAEVLHAMEAMKQVTEEVDQGVSVTDRAKMNLNTIINSMEDTVLLIENISIDISEQSKATELISKNTTVVAEKGQTGTASVQEIAGVVEMQLQDVQCNNKSAKKLLLISSSLETIMSRFDATLGEQMLGACEYIAKQHEIKELTHNDLLRLCMEMGLTEIHLTDETGTVIQSNNKSIIGFQFSAKKGDQTQEFTRILKDSTLRVNQKSAFREVDQKLFKYTGISMLHKKGIVQCGLDASKISEFIG